MLFAVFFPLHNGCHC